MLFVSALAFIVPLFSGCAAPRDMAQAQPAGSPTALVSPTSSITSATTPDTTPTTLLQVAGTITATETITATIEGTPTVRPTPAGPPPAPLNILNILPFVPPSQILVKRDSMQLDAPGPSAGDDEVLFTTTGPGVTGAITEEMGSALSVITYDPTYREWNQIWTSEVVTGTASPLLGIGQKDIGGYNGGDLLGTGDPVFAARTTMLDGQARFYMWRWNSKDRKAVPIKKAPSSAGGSDTVFEGELDINLIDLNDDRVYEVVIDNVSGVQIWKWDGNMYVPQEGR